MRSTSAKSSLHANQLIVSLRNRHPLDLFGTLKPWRDWQILGLCRRTEKRLCREALSLWQSSSRQGRILLPLRGGRLAPHEVPRGLLVVLVLGLDLAGFHEASSSSSSSVSTSPAPPPFQTPLQMPAFKNEEVFGASFDSCELLCEGGGSALPRERARS